MKVAFGGILNLALVVVFLMIVSGVLGLTVSYTKAFNFKNYVISTIVILAMIPLFDLMFAGYTW